MNQIQTIYCPIRAINIAKTPESFLIELLKKRPATYNARNKIQCAKGKDRSVYDLACILAGRFPDIDIPKTVGLLKKLFTNKSCPFRIVFCRETNRFVVQKFNTYGPSVLISSYTRDRFSKKIDTAGISLSFIDNVKKEA